MSIEDLDRLLARRKTDPELALQLQQPLSLDEFLELAQQHGLEVTEADVFAAQQRDEKDCSAAELQQRMGDEVRRLRHFIPG